MRFWLVGSGRSLTETPLDLLTEHNEVSFGMNRIHRFYNRTAWRPTYYLMVDFNTLNPEGYWRECIEAHWETPKYLWVGFRDGNKKHPKLGTGIGEVPNTTWIDRCEKHHYYMADNYKKRAQGWHLPKLCTAFSGMSTMIQQSVLLGADEIYLLGCDQYGSNYRQNHFDPEYTLDFRDRSVLDNTNMQYLHEVARRESPVPIYNATVGGALEVHPRRDMREVLGG